MYALGSLLVILLPSQAGSRPNVPKEPPAGVVAADSDWYDALSLSVSLQNYVGTGTFVASDKADNPYWASTLQLTPSFALSEHLSLFAFFSVTHEWTYAVTSCSQPDGPRPSGGPTLDCSDTDDGNARQFEASDLQLGIEYSRIPFLTIDWSTFFALSFPTNRFTRAANTALTTSLGGSASRSFGPVTTALSTSFAKFWNGGDASTLDASDLDGVVPISFCPADRLESCVPLAGFAPNWRLRLGLDGSVELGFLEGLSFALSVGYIYTRSFGRTPDGFSSAVVDGDGDRVVDGINESDSTYGSLSLNYQILPQLTTSFGVYSFQPARTADGQSLRFPFFDFVSPANNFTTWFLSVDYTLGGS